MKPIIPAPTFKFERTSVSTAELLCPVAAGMRARNSFQPGSHLINPFLAGRALRAHHSKDRENAAGAERPALPFMKWVLKGSDIYPNPHPGGRGRMRTQPGYSGINRDKKMEKFFRRSTIAQVASSLREKRRGGQAGGQGDGQCFPSKSASQNALFDRFSQNCRVPLQNSANLRYEVLRRGCSVVHPSNVPNQWVSTINRWKRTAFADENQLTSLEKSRISGKRRNPLRFSI